ncbi:MAG TPA: HipA N-terminal domain-containing protein [Gammaproteobacteria bacterium]|nr:HipA N-terminal domain-containing protein [Gammaproteobacteria bacterium]
MKKARVFVHGVFAGVLEALDNGTYCFSYEATYQGPPVSLTMPLKNKVYTYDKFPPFFEGLLPEGDMLAAMLRRYKLDRKDYFGQLLQVGRDVVGAVTIEGLV